MNILYVIPEEFRGSRWGGVTTYVMELAGMLSKSGHSVLVLTPGPKDIAYEYGKIRMYARVPRLADIGSRMALYPLKWLLPAVYGYLVWVITVRRFVRSQAGLDVVESPEWGASSVLLGWSGPPIVVRLHRSWRQYIEDNRLPVTVSVRLIDMLECLSAITASAVTSPTRFMANRHPFVNSILAMRGQRVRIIPNSVAVHTVRRKKHAPSRPYLLTVGRIETGKGSIVLARAFLRIARDFPLLDLVYIGEDTHMFLDNSWQSCREYIKRMCDAKGMGHRVVFMDRKNRTDLRKYYAECFCYVAASRGHENPSMSVLEALATGTAVVASDAGGIPEVVKQGENGAVFKQDDEESLIRSLRLVLTDRIFLGSCRKKSVSTVVPMGSIVAETVHLYGSLTR